jgi:hypothetical protein
MADDQIVPTDMALQMLSKMELVAQLHEFLLEKVDQAQKKHKKTCI